MQTRKTILYLISSLYPIYYLLLDQLLVHMKQSYAQTYQTPIAAFVICIAAPILTAILLFTQFLLKNAIRHKHQTAIDLAVLLVFSGFAALCYGHEGLFYTAVSKPLLILFLCLQTCFVIHDVTR